MDKHIEMHNLVNLIGLSLNDIQNKSTYDISIEEAITALSIVSMSMLAQNYDRDLTTNEFFEIQKDVFNNITDSLSRKDS